MLKKYLLNTSGNFSMMFGIISVMLITGIAAAVDMSGLTSQKSTLQGMSDAAVLAAVTSGEDDLEALKAIVAKHLDENNNNGFVLDWDLVLDGEEVTLVVNSAYDTKMMGFVGQDNLAVNALSSAILPGETPINIALVLDRTHSMEGANMAALKSASAVLVDMFKEYDDDTRVAVVPFSDYVNVGLSQRGETWINVPADYEIPRDCYMRQETTCTKYETRTEIRTYDGVEKEETWDQCVESVNDGPEYNYCPSPKEIEWRGCIGSRDGVYNQTAAYQGKKIPGVLDESCGEEVLTLTDNMDDVKAKINSLTTGQRTYIPVGLVNGWRMLDADKPFDDLSNKEEKRKRALILMTDGANTMTIENPYVEGKHDDDGDVNDTNDLTKVLCDNIKDADIDIWTVAYNFEGADSKDMLKDCATSSSQYFDADNEAELTKAFEDIGNSLFSVRLTR